MYNTINFTYIFFIICKILNLTRKENQISYLKSRYYFKKKTRNRMVELDIINLKGLKLTKFKIIIYTYSYIKNTLIMVYPENNYT